eukprot:TRINITY_DN7186_c0_g1_i1.p1 TRINITY_DN7186_c0_g1~~TRINITY_DN7186_c0_g1_i1.p1  ORF type:complete len:319 (+),score=30.41 TRINITY_DN7186_c0_g1_i1:320-1276(+)
MRKHLLQTHFDLEKGQKKRRRPTTMVGSKPNPFLCTLVSMFVLTFILILLSVLQQGPAKENFRDLQDEMDDYPLKELKNLVMVAGHSVYMGNKCGKGGGDGDEGAWFLESYQRHPGQAATFVEHIKVGVEVAGRDKKALLLFSGGETRRDAGPRSEAQSYWSVADSHGWFGEGTEIQKRALTEEHARDSFENLLFSICRFRELTGSYPINITVVGYDFKERRFAYLHRSALRFPRNRFYYVGTPPSLTSLAAALKGESLVRQQFQKDPYGCYGSLRLKKIGRDPFHRTIPYPKGCPELRGLFRYCGRTPFSGSLPWDN